MPDDVTLCDSGTGQCHLCGDVAAVGKVVSIDVRRRIGTVSMDDVLSTVAFDFVDAAVGDHVLVHLGFAIERVSDR
jgi:hydrogenase maturation factor